MSIRENLVRALYSSVASPAVAPVVERLSAIAERQSLGDLLSRLGIDCLIDVGGNEGQYARLIRRLGFNGLILSFEPNQEVFKIMQQARANDSAWKGFNCGLGREDGELDFNVYECSQISSFLPGNKHVNSPLIRTTKVPVRRLDAFLPTVLPEWKKRRMFLKCDTQGFDLEVVKGSEGVLESVYGLQSEVAVQSLYEGMPRYLETMAFYESLGFDVIDLWLNNRTLDGRALEYDCLMAKTAKQGQ